jgi:hypothetical protein
MISRIIRVNGGFASWANERNRLSGWSNPRFTDMLFKKRWLIERILDDPKIEKQLEKVLRNGNKK